MRHCRCLAFFHRQTRLRSIQRLDLTLLIHAQHCRTGRRAQVGPADPLGLLHLQESQRQGNAILDREWQGRDRSDWDVAVGHVSASQRLVSQERFLAALTAVGGGTVRDVLLDRNPVFWIERPEILLIVVLAAVLVFLSILATKD